MRITFLTYTYTIKIHGIILLCDLSLSDTLRNIEERAQDAARAKTSAVAAIYVLSVVVVPAAYSILIANWTGFLEAFSVWAAVGSVLFIVVIHSVFAYLAYALSTADNFYFDYRDVERAHTKAEEKSNHFSEHLAREEKITGVIRLMLVALSAFATFGRSNTPLSPAQVNSQVRKLMFPIIASREVIPFRGARYNFAIYLYDDQSDVLKKFYRTHHPSIDVRNRDILPNQGHVGTCFSKEEDIFSPDTLNAPALMFRDEDETTPYRSIGAAPISTITSSTGTSKTRGVFIITSDEPGQIRQDQHQTLVNVVALILSLFFDEADQYIQRTQTYV